MEMDRRSFCRTITAAGAGLAMAHPGVIQVRAAEAAKAKSEDQLNVALIGSGAEGLVLIQSCLNIPGIRFQAVCDIWSFSQKNARSKLYRHNPNIYEDYREMLDKEKDLDAVIVATPDWLHAEHANACMEAGHDVYCEKEMSNDLEKAKSMVLTSRRTGKLLQIGHQRRSNPRYIHAFQTLVREMGILGRVTHAQAQWNRKAIDFGWNRRETMSPEKLEQYGYNTMPRFRNWRWCKKYGGGPIVDLGSHQIDIFAWVFGANPKSVIASGGQDYFKHHEWYDNVLCIYEYENDQGTSRAFYQTLTTSGHGGFHEVFMGEHGTAVMAEVPPQGNWVEREETAPSWDALVAQGYLLPKEQEKISPVKTKKVAVDSRVSPEPDKWPIPIQLAKPAHQPHLENFFNAIRHGEKLNCPAEVGYETAVAVLAANRAVASGKRIEFKKEDFHV